MLNTIRKVCVLPKDKFHVNLSTTGNTVSSTVLIGLKDCMETHAIKSGDKVMVSGFGVGLSWGGTVLFF
jgi:3-oxoacyl-[acyl-carrier-protein] synthase-3